MQSYWCTYIALVLERGASTYCSFSVVAS